MFQKTSVSMNSSVLKPEPTKLKAQKFDLAMLLPMNVSDTQSKR